MKAVLRKTLSFVLRDLRIAMSYPFAFILGFGGIFFSVLIWFFFSRMIEGGSPRLLEKYGGGYFSFVIVGIALQNYLSVAMGGLTRSIRESQMLGTLEMLLASPTSLPLIIFASSVGPFLVTTFRILIYFSFGIVCGMHFHVKSPPAVLVVFFLSIISFSTLGIISASIILVIKRGDPVSLLVSAFSTLFSGIYYPVEVLPGFLQKVAWFVPVTHSAEALRMVLLSGKTMDFVMPQIIWLSVFSLLALPLSLTIFSRGVKIARIHGTLGHF